MNIEKMMDQYLLHKGIIAIGENTIEGYRSRLVMVGIEQKNSEIDCIEGLQLSAQIMSDIPISHTNKFYSKTEQVALNYRKDLLQVFTKEEINQEISDIQSRLFPLKYDTKIVEIFISCLGAEEKFIVENFYIQHLKWSYVANRYRETFGEYRHPETLKKIRQNALKKFNAIIL